MTTLGLLVCLESVQVEAERTRRDIEELFRTLLLYCSSSSYLSLLFISPQTSLSLYPVLPPSHSIRIVPDCSYRCLIELVLKQLLLHL